MTDPPEDIYEQFNRLLDLDTNQDAFKDLCGVILRMLWHLHLTPLKEARDLGGIYATFLVPYLRRQLGGDWDDRVLNDFAVEIANDVPDEAFIRHVSTMPFEDYVTKQLFSAADPDELSLFETVWRQWEPRIVRLTPAFVSSIRTVHEEYVQWLRHHPDVLDKIAWEAFEEIIAEIFASKGFHVDLTGRLRNRSADLIAIRSDEFGVETKYLIECKKYSETRRIGMDVVNGVIGAARRADVDHAFLVTSSFYTRDVVARKTEFEQLRMHLRDGDDVREWLRSYRATSEGGLWLSPGWDDDIQQSHRPRQ